MGVDWLVYQTVDDLVASATEGNPTLTRFDCSVFDGDYITGDIDDDYLTRLSLTRSDRMKQRREAERMGIAPTALDLQNVDA